MTERHARIRSQRVRAASVSLAALFILPTVASVHAGSLRQSRDAAAFAHRLQSVEGAGLLGSKAFDYITTLSDTIGARLTGSPANTRAVAWAIDTMKAIGLENVHPEPFSMWRGWTRGTAEAVLVAPVERRLLVDAMGWTGSTPAGGVDADVVRVDVGELTKELDGNAVQWTGKILLTWRADPPDPSHAASDLVLFDRFLVKAAEVHAVGVISGQNGSSSEGVKLTHTGVMRFSTAYDVPVVSMAAEDQAQLERMLDDGRKVRLHLAVTNTFTAGPVQTANVVGDIPGTEDPEQVIVVGGHLDSWDLAQGATDNGCGVAATLAAADAIIRAGVKPRRTIRFVLFNGEEEGLLGSFAYLDAHRTALAQHLGAFVLDHGQGAITALNAGGRDDIVEPLTRLADLLDPLGVSDVTNTPTIGTDTAPFTLAGLPGMDFIQDRTPYGITHHSAADTLDKVSEEILVRNAAIVAVAAFWTADRPARLAAPWTPERTRQMLVARNQDGLLKAFGMWPWQ